MEPCERNRCDDCHSIDQRQVVKGLTQPPSGYPDEKRQKVQSILAQVLSPLPYQATLQFVAFHQVLISSDPGLRCPKNEGVDPLPSK